LPCSGTWPDSRPVNVAFYREEPLERRVHRFGLLRQRDMRGRRG
jgi:hypothetical protein